MRAFRQWLGSSLRRKLSIIMLVSTLVPLLSLGIFTYFISSNITKEKSDQTGIDSLRRMNAYLRFIVSDLENISMSLIGQGDIQRYLRGSDSPDSLRTQILAFITNLSSYKPYISNITIYPASMDEYLSTATIYRSDLNRQVNIASVREKTWTGIYSVFDYSGTHDVFTFVRPIRSVYAYKSTMGWLAISLDENALARYWAELNPGEGRGQVALLNEAGIVLSSTEHSWLGQSFERMYPDAYAAIAAGVQGDTFSGDDGKRTILFNRDSDIGWTFVATIPYDLYRSQNNYILQLTAVAVVITILIVVGSLLFVIHRVTNPLRVLTRLLTKVNPDGLMPYYHASSADEIGQLGASYNKLGMYIKRLKEQLIRQEARKKEADIRALQAQINPHFLYNTLSSVHWMALMREEKQIADMVGALSDFLQFSLNRGNEYCPIHQEISHIRNYIQIQQIRYPDQIELDLIADPQLLDKWMLKLLLQPLIENALIHGILKKKERGRITVYMQHRGRRMQVLVMDDGAGMSEQRLQELRRALAHDESEEAGPAVISSDTGSGYGLRNVSERLRLHYGPDARLEVDSRLHAGTQFSFTIPLLEGFGENHDRG
ncbi:sensor histidine kinase [Cohnella cellulosilytica]|uniref:histidine kinase n=1 Tax=Cohnella cellulosilytica TaxID=986710 RepID=A0ABW2FIU4_9BACL